MTNIEWKSVNLAIVSKYCFYTQKTNKLELPITQEQWQLFCSEDRPLIQEVFPHLSRSQREFLITGLLPENQKYIFGEIDDFDRPQCEEYYHA